LEVGSLDINGSVRIVFERCDYLGVDLGEGKGVDLVCPGHLLEFPASSFDTVISCQCFEHDVHWQETRSHEHHRAQVKLMAEPGARRGGEGRRARMGPRKAVAPAFGSLSRAHFPPTRAASV